MHSDDRKIPPVEPEHNGRDSVAGSPADPLLKPRDAARYLAMSIRQLSDRPDIPRVDTARSGARRRQIRYRKSDLDRFIVSRQIGQMTFPWGAD